MNAGYGSVINKSSGFATLSLVVITLLLMSVVTLLTSDLMHAELQIGYSELAFRQARIDAESRMALAVAQVAELGMDVPESQALANGVLWWKSYPAAGAGPLVTLVADGSNPSGDAQARVRQQVGWMPLFPDLPPTALLAPGLYPRDDSATANVEPEAAEFPLPSLNAPIITTEEMQGYLDQLFMPQGEKGARIRWLEDQASSQQQGCDGLNARSSGLILVLGNCIPTGSIGSAEAPVILMIRDGGLYLQGSDTIDGLVILYSAVVDEADSDTSRPISPSVQLLDASGIEGALLSQYALAGDSRRLPIQFAPQTLQRLQELPTFYRLVSVTGSWRDW
jgi:hypothetical protein